jgi:hypothetical protein
MIVERSIGWRAPGALLNPLGGKSGFGTEDPESQCRRERLSGFVRKTLTRDRDRNYPKLLLHHQSDRDRAKLLLPKESRDDSYHVNPHPPLDHEAYGLPRW